MAQRFLKTGGASVTWDASNTAIWSTTSGGSTGASVPGIGDTVVMDGGSGGGTVTLGAAYNPSVISITMGAFTGTFDVSVNNNSPTVQTFSCSGTGTRTLNMGSGTWTITGNNTTVFDITTTTGLTLNPGTSTINLTYAGSTGTRGVVVSLGFSVNTIKVSAGSDTVSFGRNTFNGDVDFTGFTGALTLVSATTTVFGSLTFGAGMTAIAGSQNWTLTPSASKTLTSNGVTIGRGITIAGTGGGSITLADALLMTVTFTLTSGAFSANNNNITCLAFSSSNSNTRTLTMGSGTWTLTGSGTTVWTTQTTTGLTITPGTSTIDCTYSGSVGTRTIRIGTAAVNNFKISAGSDIISTGNGDTFLGNLDFTGFTGTWGGATATVGGNFTLGTGMTATSSNSLLTLNPISGTKQFKSNSVQFNRPVTVNATVGATVQLFDDLDITGATAFNLGLGTGGFDSNGKNVKTTTFNSSNSNTRVLTMGSSTWTITGNAATVWSMATVTGLTVTANTATINFTYSGSTGTRTISTGQTSSTQLNNINITAGSDTVSLGSNAFRCNDLNFTGFSGTYTGGNGDNQVSGNLTLASGMTVTSSTGTLRFVASSGNKTITSNGVQINKIISIDNLANNSTAIYTLADNFDMSGAAQRAFTLVSGSLNDNGKNVTAGSFLSTNSNTRSVTRGSGTWTLTGTGIVWDTSTTTGLTYNTGTGTTKVTDSSNTTITFNGGGLTFNKLWFSRGASSAIITINGANTFNEIKDDGSIAHTIVFPNAITMFTTWSISGLPGQLISIGSGAHQLVKAGGGVVTADYLNIANSSATPAVGTFFAGLHSVDSGGNSGWIFNPQTATNFFAVM